MKTNPFARLFAVLGVIVLLCVLVFGRDNKLAKQGQAPAGPVAAGPANSEALSPTIQGLAEVPAQPAPAQTSSTPSSH